MQILNIEELTDPRVADYQKLKEAQLAKSRGVFIVEGAEVLRGLLLRSNYQPKSVFISEKRLDSLRDAFDASKIDCPIYVASPDVMSGVVGFDIHRGVLAAVERSQQPSAKQVLQGLGRSPSLVVVSEGVGNHDNIGAFFRNAAAFGADAVFLDSTSADPFYRKSIRVSMGHALRVPFACLGTIEETISELKRRNYRCCALTPRPGAWDLPLSPQQVQELSGQKLALLVGTEGTGLTQKALDSCDIALRIPMAPDVDSLNAATSLAVALYAVKASLSI